MVTTYNDTDGTAYVTPQYCPDCLSPDLANKTTPLGTLAFQEFDGSDPGNATTCILQPVPEIRRVSNTLHEDRYQSSMSW
jgi:hypothetical protein